jgi:hypothetical protein
MAQMDIRDFLAGLSDEYLQEHLRAYIRTGLDDRAALAQAEIDRRAGR